MRTRGLLLALVTTVSVAACGRVAEDPGGTMDGSGGSGGSGATGGQAPGGAPTSGGGAQGSSGASSSGGATSTGGAFSSGGASATGGAFATGGASGAGTTDAGGDYPGDYPGAPLCSSGCPDTPGRTQCCTSTGRCGIVSTSPETARGCLPLFEPGMMSDACSVPSSGHADCCRFDGTCGIEMSLGGPGCAEPSAARAGQACTVGGACRFVFQVTTVTANGTYAPHNAGAVWIEDESGRFVKTLDTWSYIMLSRVVAWWRSSAGNNVDAVSGATRPNHGPLLASWNCTDVNHAAVPEGRYRVCMTFAEDNTAVFSDAGPAAYLCVPFERTSKPLSVSFPDDAYFRDMRLWMN